MSTKLDREQIKHVLRTDPTNWGVGFFDIQMRHQYYVQAAQEIERLEQQLKMAKTAALLDVSKIMAARGDWQLASEIIAYRNTDLHTLDCGPDTTPVLPIDSIVDLNYNTNTDKQGAGSPQGPVGPPL